MAAAGHGQTANPCCDLFQCFCCWRVSCSDSIHRFAPGMDYLRIQDGADDSPMWSVLVGCTCADEKLHNLRLHRFRVASSGRVFGHSNDMLELFSSVHPKDRMDTVFADATASLAPGGGRLNIICSHSPVPEPRKISTSNLDLPPKAVTFDLVNKTLSPETPLPFLHGAYHAVSAHGEFWAAAVVVEECPAITWRLVVHRLASGGNSWVEVASYNFPERPEPIDRSLFSGTALPGYAVLNDKFILLSLIDSTFFCFNCVTGSLTRVPTTRKASMYVRISGRAVHVQGSEDDGGTIYFVDCTKLFAYKYMPEEDMPLEPPVMVDILWPYYCEGYGFIVQLVGKMLCAVWINMNEACSCATRHALITTFSVRSVTKPKGEGSSDHSIEVLHSTCRRVDMIRDESLGYHYYDTFAILQEYPDHAANVYDTSLPAMSGVFSHPVEDSQEILTCCRNYLRSIGKLVWSADNLVACGKGIIEYDLYFICQVDQHSFLYQISTSGGKLACHGCVLEPKSSLDTIRDGGVSVDLPATWHFLRRGSTELFVIPSFPHNPHYKVDVRSMSYSLFHSRMCPDHLSAVFTNGEAIMALGDKLMDVYILDKTDNWEHWPTSSRTLDLEQKVKISGYVCIHSRAFLISDADTDKCFLLDLVTREWVVVEPPKVNNWFGLVGLLSGKCFYTRGFIYTCADEGLVAYELLEDNTSYSLGTPILLEFSWSKFSDRRFRSFDRISVTGDWLVFCVIEGYFLVDPDTSLHDLTSTIVIVEYEDDHRKRRVPARLKHVDVAVSSVKHEGPILTNYAFTVRGKVL